MRMMRENDKTAYGHQHGFDTIRSLYRYITKITLLVVGRYHDTPTVIVT